MSRQIYAVPDLCCIVSQMSVESVGGVFDPVVSSAIAVFVVSSAIAVFAVSSAVAVFEQ